jgi:hypothetical protein
VIVDGMTATLREYGTTVRRFDSSSLRSHNPASFS